MAPDTIMTSTVTYEAQRLQRRRERYQRRSAAETTEQRANRLQRERELEVRMREELQERQQVKEKEGYRSKRSLINELAYTQVIGLQGITTVCFI